VGCEWQPPALQWERWGCSIWNAGREICRQECYLETSLNFHHYLMADQWQCAMSQTHLDSSLLLGRTLHTSLEMQLDPETEHLSQEWYTFQYWVYVSDKSFCFGLINFHCLCPLTETEALMRRIVAGTEYLQLNNWSKVILFHLLSSCKFHFQIQLQIKRGTIWITIQSLILWSIMSFQHSLLFSNDMGTVKLYAKFCNIRICFTLLETSNRQTPVRWWYNDRWQSGPTV